MLEADLALCMLLKNRLCRKSGVKCH